MAAKSPVLLTGEDEINHFKAIPWCAKHLEAPNLRILPAFSSLCHKAEEGEDALLAKTLHTADTMPAFLLIYPRPQDENAPVPEVKALFTLGDMVGGYPGISHGGMSATVYAPFSFSLLARRSLLSILMRDSG